jgi:hypothetical protein
MKWIYLAWDRVKRQVILKALMDFTMSLKSGKFVVGWEVVVFQEECCLMNLVKSFIAALNPDIHSNLLTYNSWVL